MALSSRNIRRGMTGAVAAALAVLAVSISGGVQPASATTSFAPSVVATIPVGAGPMSITAGPSGVYVANSSDGTVTVIDPTTNTVKSTLHTGVSPYQTLEYNGQLFVANSIGGTVAVYDTSNFTLTASISVALTAVALSECGGLIWVASATGDHVTAIDPTTNALATAFTNPVTVGNGPTYLATAAGKLYVSVPQDHSSSVIDCASGAVLGSRSFGSYTPGPLGVTAAHVAIGLTDRPTMWFYDETTDVANTEFSWFGLVNPTYNLQAVGAAFYVIGSASDTVGRGSDDGNSLTIVMPAISLPTGSLPQAITAYGGDVYIAGSGNGTVSILDSNTNTVTSTLSVGAYPMALAVSGRFVYVVNQTDETVSVIEAEAAPPAPAPTPSPEPAALASTGVDGAALSAPAAVLGLIGLGALGIRRRGQRS